MTQRRISGLWLSVTGSKAEAVLHSIEERNSFSMTVVNAEAHPRKAELAIICISPEEPGAQRFLEEAALYIGVSQAGRLVATGESSILVSNLHAIETASIATITTQLPKRFASSFDPPWWTGVYRPSPRLWETILEVLAKVSTESRENISRLWRAAQSAAEGPLRVNGGLDIYERDAIATALQAWRGDGFRKRVLREAIIPGSVPTASFLQKLQQVSVREDPQINHDATVFPGYEVASRSAIGSVTLSDGGEYLTILNCNRQPLETTLGVDLIYYNHQFDSFVLVQYKRMTMEGGEPVYRPTSDNNHDDEIRRMLEAQTDLERCPTSSLSVSDFRLSERPFYLKLCEPKLKAALDPGMVPGMYVPLNLWTRLLKSDSVLGPRGGVSITWDNCRRRLNNSEFTHLLRNGWVGSSIGASAKLATIIETVLQAGHMVIIGATSPREESPDYRRDGFGRFAADDAPDAVI